MALITYNNLDDYSGLNLLSLTEIPNILKISDNVQGTKAQITLSFDGNLRTTVSGDAQYYITILGETVSNVQDPKNAKNKRFFISADEDSTSMSIARALRNCGSLQADFDIIHSASYIYLVAKEMGSKFTTPSNDIQSNISSQFFNYTFSDGSVNSDYFNGKITVDVYKGSNTSISNYVTTLEKNFYGNECAFDVSPVLSTLSEYGKTMPFTLDMNLTKGIGRSEGDWEYLGSCSGYTTIGYHANLSEKCIEMVGARFLTNNKRGNKTITRYVYNNTIPYSVLRAPSITRWNLRYSLKDSAFNEVFNSGAITMSSQGSSSLIIDEMLTIPTEFWSSTYYIDIQVGSDNPIRFNVIKPLNATEYYQRVMWRNEYGGLDFFDFTNTRSESDSVNIETYEKNVFDYHEREDFERKIIYKNDYEKTVTLTSHLMEENGKYTFNSLMRSKDVWTFIGGKKYHIIPKSVDVQEDQTYNNIYTVKLEYTYSDI